MEATDQELLDAARRGDNAALEALLLRHQDRVYRFGVKLCRDPEDAADVLQETLLSMARSVHDFRGKSSLSTWLYTVARSFCIKKRRKSRYAPARPQSLESEAAREVQDLADNDGTPEKAVLGKEVSSALEQAIRSLEPGLREVLLLRDAEGLSAAEVAEITELSVAAVKSRLHRARLAVRERIAPLLGVSHSATNCPDILGTYSRYVENDVSPELCARMEEHVQACSGCRSACDSLKQTLALCRAAPGDRVPPEVSQAVRKALADVLNDE